MGNSREQELVYVAQPDWWSRLVAIGALAVAGTALYWSYLQNQQRLLQTTDQAAEIRTAVADGVQSIRDEGGRERRQMDSYLASALTKIDQQVAERSPAPSTPTTFEEPIASPPDTSLGKEPAPSRPADALAESKPPDLSSPAADLVEVEAVLRVDQMGSRPTLVMRNRGAGPARITHVRFVPTSEFDQVPLTVARMNVGDTRADHLVVRFGTADNLATNPDLQGTYEQALSSPFEISADQQIVLRVVIVNRDHRGFGLKGRLSLLDDGKEIASFEEVAVPFIVGP